jgi:hypothetical protein
LERKIHFADEARRSAKQKIYFLTVIINLCIKIYSTLKSKVQKIEKIFFLFLFLFFPLRRTNIPTKIIRSNMLQQKKTAPTKYKPPLILYILFIINYIYMCVACENRSCWSVGALERVFAVKISFRKLPLFFNGGVRGKFWSIRNYELRITNRAYA